MMQVGNNPSGPVPADLAALVTRKEALAILSISGSVFDARKALGELPEHVVIGGCHRWRRQELLDWIEAGCPPQSDWRARRAARKR